MRKYYLAILLLAFMPSVWSYGNISINSVKPKINQKVKPLRLTGKIKPKCILLVDNPFYIGFQGSSQLLLKVNLLLVNNTKDTLKYLGTNRSYSKLYKVNNTNMVIIDGDYGKKAICLIIPPLRSVETQLTFRFNKMPDTTFNFKIGMHLVKWKGSCNIAGASKLQVGQANILWTENEVFRTNKKHEMVGLPFKEQIKKQNELILKKPLPIYYSLTTQDRKDYVLSVDQRKVEKFRDTLIFGKSYRFTRFPLVITNKAADTLKYINMTCSWWDIYRLSVKEISLLDGPCDANYPRIITVAPRKSAVINVSVLYVKGSLGNSKKLKIGMSLQKYISREQLFQFDAYAYLLRPETSNLIWSNEVMIQ